MQNSLLKTTRLSRNNTGKTTLLATVLLGSIPVQQAHAAIVIDKTRMIFDGNQASVSLNVSNQDKQQPYLVQGWIEDEQGQKIHSPFTVIPPLQRIEPNSPG